ncbi:MAG TPA: toll/interleukin-1 receptor domain-containing protein [Vitreimonas sp.]|jgi:hypothetical protein|nr:toll/interleukin-1 receptor domain-containing protein [Vitreimonas sp.]
MAHFFLSYARADADVALRLANDLRRAGAQIWVDQLDIKPSDRWDRAVEAGLRESIGVVLVMSPRSVASENVLDEISVALDAGKQVVPVLVEACQAPLRLARVQFIDATRDYDAALQACAAALTKVGAGAPVLARTPIASSLIELLAAKLTPILGPISRHLVEDEAREANGEADLIARVRARVPASERDRFAAILRDLGR